MKPTFFDDILLNVGVFIIACGFGLIAWRYARIEKTSFIKELNDIQERMREAFE